MKMAQTFAPLILVMGLKKLQLPEEDMLLYSRSVFAIRTIIELCVLGIIYMKLQSAPEGPKVPAHEKAVGFGQKESVPEMSQKEYDNNFFQSQAKGSLFQIGLLGFLHIKFNFVQPLLISSIVALFKLATNESVKVFLLGRDIKRPYGDVSPPAVEEEEEKEEDDKKGKKDKKQIKESKKDK
eukprot:CAMPEP_0194584564 /NCGR_PEP_ID=MMETSP0292-20121207/17119_1 /TAXON_ID=39354 /ORGANISM="Heterosigma akashiwo, Strain CCMP2393" /LENGTH=181 /DNA_ID=CAMNT_0039439619 /DNA_START=42 /DNA_END=587 /DNA_ORIENTATION=-